MPLTTTRTLPLATASSLTIVIPAYNEEGGLGATLESLHNEARLDGAEIIVIDDGSTDATAEVAIEHGARVIRNWSNLGYGASLKRGVRAADTELVAWFDADGQHSAADLADMVERLYRERAEAVFGARDGASHVVRNRVLGKRIIRLAAEAAAGREIPDFNCGLRVFRRRVLMQYLNLLPDGFSASTTSALLYMKRNNHLVFHPITVGQRIGKSSVRQLRDGMRALHTILRITIMFNAFRTFSICAGAMIAMGVLYGTVLAILHGAGFPVLAAMTIILGVQVFVTGVVCDQISAMRIEQLGRHDQETEEFEEQERRQRVA